MWHRIESAGKDPGTQNFRDKGGTSNHYAKYGLFNKYCWNNWVATYKKVKLYPYFISCARINSKWVRDLNVENKIKQVLNKRKHAFNLGVGKALPVTTQNQEPIKDW